MEEMTLLNDRYRLHKPLGSGGMAVVYKAVDEMLERAVAIKILREDYAKDSAFRERFRQEAKSAANLSHPNIVTVHDFGLNADQVFIVIEYIDGTDLKTLIRRNGQFTIEETLDLMTQACAGIGYAHRAGLVHCDVKPHNMLVSLDNRLKVTDFGIARALATIHPDERLDVVWGSPHYFSPEQAAGGAPSPASDVYSLGIILYEMLTNQLPFNAGDATELARMHREETPISPSKHNPNIPEPLEEIILKVLSKEPSARYRTADQLGQVLRSFGQLNQDPLKSSVLPPQLNGSLKPEVQDFEPKISPVENSELQSPDKNDPISTAEAGESIDWITWILGLLAFTAILGLIPFWLFIYYSINP